VRRLDGRPRISHPDDKGNWIGLDVDFCRAVAAATLGDASKVKYIPLNSRECFSALQSGEIDLLSRGTTYTLTRDSSLGLNFAGVTYYDGQGFLVAKKRGAKDVAGLKGAAICVLAGTTSEANLAAYFRQHKMEFRPVIFDTSPDTLKGLETGRCDALTSDQSATARFTARAGPSGCLCHPAGRHLEGTPGAGRAPGR